MTALGRIVGELNQKEILCEEKTFLLHNAYCDVDHACHLSFCFGIKLCC